MAKITIADIIGGFASVLGLNSRFQQIEDELNNKVLYRNNPGSEANEMNTPLDMNGKRIINLPMPIDSGEPARLQDLLDVYSGTTQHSYLLGLDVDDHPQYHNNARGDLRYLQIGGDVDGALVTDNGEQREIQTALSNRPVMFESTQALLLEDLSGYDRVGAYAFYTGWEADTTIPLVDIAYRRVYPALIGTPSTLFADNSGFYDANGDGFSLTIFNKRITPYQFGAYGNGGTNDDTPAIEKMWAYYISKTKHFHSVAITGEQSGAEISTGIFWEPGDYSYNGTGLINDSADNKSIRLMADPETVRIRIVSDVYLITADDVNNAHIRGINFFGGKGVFRSIYTGNNVRDRFYVGHCKFQGYTECAIGHNAEDWNNWAVEYCRFRGDTSSNPIGIALHGFHDNASIRHCLFDRNKYDIKVGERPGGNLHIENNDFIFLSSTSTNRIAHIWFVPNSTDPSGVPSGQNITVTKNKFGNESMAADDWRFLFAPEDTLTGTDNLSHPHSTTWDTAGFISGIKFIDNNFAGIGSQTAALMYSYVRNVRHIVFKQNLIMSGDHTYLIEWNSDLDGDEHSSTWEIEYALAGSAPHVRFMPVSNQPMGLVRDPFIQSGGDQKTIECYPSLQDDVSFSELVAIQDPGTDGSVVNATRTGATDSLGGGKAAEIDASTSTGRWVSAAFDPAVGVPSFIELDIKAASTNSCTKVEVWIRHSVTNLYLIRRYITCDSTWKRIRIPFTPQVNDGAANSYNLAVQVLDFSEGVTDRFEIGRLCVYQSRSAAHYGHLQTHGDGTWDGEHLIIGPIHHWYDFTNITMRYKNGAPSSEVDGTAY